MSKESVRNNPDRVAPKYWEKKLLFYNISVMEYLRTETKPRLSEVWD